MFKNQIKRGFKKRRGSALIIIIAVMIFATAATALMVDLITVNRRQAVTQSEDVQLYYLTKVGLDSVVESLTNERGTIKVEDYKLVDPGFTPQKIEFKDNSGKKVGECKIKVKRIEKLINGSMEPWIEITAETTMKDSLNASKDYKKTGAVQMSVKNSMIREYDIKID